MRDLETKVKLFKATVNEVEILQKRINSWLEKNKGVTIEKVDLSAARHDIYYSILYTEREKIQHAGERPK